MVHKTTASRRSEFPENWEEFTFGKTLKTDKLTKECIREYLSDPYKKLDQIARNLGLRDRRYVGVYLSRAKKTIQAANKE